MGEYWKLSSEISNVENQKVINEFLLHQKNANRSKHTITTYKYILQRFFNERTIPFWTTTSNEIKEWHNGQHEVCTDSIISLQLSTLRIFYSFCVGKGYMDKSPFEKGDPEKYWIVKKSLSNKENQKIINEFLLILKKENMGKRTIINSRINLQYFFKDREELFSSISSDEIKIWVTELQKIWKKETIWGHLHYLRSFFIFCVNAGYVKESPLPRRGREIDGIYWKIKDPLSNKKNQEVINEYLLSLKVMNYSQTTVKKYRYFLQTFFKEREELFLCLSSEDIQEWLSQHEKGLKEETISFHLSVLKSFYAFCVEEDYIKKNPIKTRWFPRLPKPAPKYLGKDEVAKVRQQGEKECLRNIALLEFLLSSGCRIGEVHMLNREDLDLGERTALVCGKGKKIRQVHFSEKCAVLLENYNNLRVDDDPALFVTKFRNPQRLSKHRMQVIMKRIGNRAMLSRPLHPHRLRHTFATEFLAKGAELSFIGDELGHSDLTTTLIYARLPKREIISMYRKYMG